MSFGTIIEIDEEVVPNEPWDELEQNFFNSIRLAMRKVEDGKRNVDCRSNQEARGTQKVSGSKKRRKDSSKKT